ncbi:hypothetical protein HK414_00885 [Ramlibacter terrae]|uniref:Uncharacterized protein n=1 Tax=Ramlibacter terrae TaxID=2732511 RepID=A0ABX6P2U9_9BURK|nr:hypothetical protein HK414_00885 [Ramlibacter terrae]
MKIWHKILVGPSVAILFLPAPGALSAGMMMRQATAMSELVKVRGVALEMAMASAQEVGDVHANVYRTFTGSTTRERRSSRPPPPSSASASTPCSAA